LEPLTARENELLQLVADGHSNRSISEISDLTESTVKWHLGNVYSKLGVKKRTQAVANGRQLGLIT
jgi:LuxR family maltose regulon positive regulatory protein